MRAGERAQKQRLTDEDGQTAQEHQSLLIKKQKQSWQAGNRGAVGIAALAGAAGTRDPDGLWATLRESCLWLAPKAGVFQRATAVRFPLSGLGTPAVPEPSRPWASTDAAVWAQTLNRGRDAWSVGSLPTRRLHDRSLTRA